LIVGVPAETTPGERRVALVPDAVKALVSGELQVVVEAGAGTSAGFEDAAFTAAGARIADRAAALAADVVVKVQPPRERSGGGHEVDDLRSGAVLIAFLRPLDEPALAKRLAARGVTAFAMELVPRITRAQAMDALSSMSNLAGYRAVLLGASRKSFIGRLAKAPSDDRLSGSLSAALLGAAQGVQILRVHDVAATRQALAVWEGARGQATGS